MNNSIAVAVGKKKRRKVECLMVDLARIVSTCGTWCRGDVAGKRRQAAAFTAT
jgi:hypothetical protein